MQFWCSATGQPWTWAWRAYPGAWLFAALLVVLYVAIRRRSGVHPWPAWRTLLFGLGLLAAWSAVDWPIGALGSGYLLSLHEVQYLLLGIIAPALLWLSLPAEVTLGVPAASRTGRLLRFLAAPLPALVAYTLALVLTHLPPLSDALMPTQLGSLAIDLAWLFAGLWYWWVVVAPEGINRVRAPLRIAYLFGSTLLPTVPAAFITFAKYPLYRLYELAPPVVGWSATSDQVTAGIIMKLGADPIIWLAMGIVFFRWSSAEGDKPPA
ncbi:MAG TPA: cytochrome c oxidase assembly protein [Gemmatimonadales bacterium]|nr:cytochrome c oxidase assembly protein [Gemmatimonadales bacterium]